jgi:hypothetical protein
MRGDSFLSIVTPLLHMLPATLGPWIFQSVHTIVYVVLYEEVRQASQVLEAGDTL